MPLFSPSNALAFPVQKRSYPSALPYHCRTGQNKVPCMHAARPASADRGEGPIGHVVFGRRVLDAWVCGPRPPQSTTNPRNGTYIQSDKGRSGVRGGEGKLENGLAMLPSSPLPNPPGAVFPSSGIRPREKSRQPRVFRNISVIGRWSIPQRYHPRGPPIEAY